MDPFSEILTPAKQNHWQDVRISEHDGWGVNGGVTDPSDADLASFFGTVKSQQLTHSQQIAVEIAQRSQLQRRHAYAANTMRYQIALRAFDPDCIYQGGFGFCGPAAILYQFANRWPDRYAQCLVNLHNGRDGTLMVHEKSSHLALRADKDWDTHYSPASTQMGPADFLILHAIRRAAEVQGVPSFDPANPGTNKARQATHPSKMKELLEQAGYRNVQNKTFWAGRGWFPEKHPSLGDHIQQCAALTQIDEGPVVIMLSHPWLGVVASGGPDWEGFEFSPGRKEPESLAELHWICVNRLEQNAAKVTMRFMSYGTRCWHAYDRHRFRHCYYGYVSAEP